MMPQPKLNPIGIAAAQPKAKGNPIDPTALGRPHPSPAGRRLNMIRAGAHRAEHSSIQVLPRSSRWVDGCVAGVIVVVE